MYKYLIPSVLYNKNFLKLWGSQVLSQVALNALYFLLAIQVWERTSSNTAVSFIILSFGLPAVLFGPIAGVLVDRADTKQVLIISSLLRAIMVLGFLFILEKPFAMIPVVILISLVNQFFIPAEGSSIPSLVEREKLLSANSLFSLTLNFSTIVGFVAAGLLVKIFSNVAWPVVISFIFLFLSFVIIFFLPKIEGRSGGGGFREIFQELLIAIKFVWEKVTLRASLLTVSIFSALILIFASISFGFATMVLKIKPEDVSTHLVLPAIGGVIVGTIFLGRFGKRYPEGILISNSILLSGVGIFLISLYRASFFTSISPLILLVLIFALGFVSAGISIPAWTILHKGTPPELRGRVWGLINSLVSGAAFIPIIFASGLADIFGVRWVVTLGGILIFLAGLYLRRKNIYSEVGI